MKSQNYSAHYCGADQCHNAFEEPVFPYIWEPKREIRKSRDA